MQEINNKRSEKRQARLIYILAISIFIFSLFTLVFAIGKSSHKYTIIEKLENINIISKDINLIEEKIIENSISNKINTIESEVKNVNSNNALYKYEFDQGKSLYFTLDSSESKSKLLENSKFTKLHTNNFWDPKKCSQMQSIVGSENIVFMDSYVEFAETPGFNTFIYKYNKERKNLIEFKSPISLTKIYRTKDKGGSESFLTISKIRNNYKANDKTQKYRMYKINFESKKLEFIKDVYQDNKYQLLTATNILIWCEQFSAECKKEDSLNIIENNLNLEINKSNQNVYTVNVKYENTEVLNLREADELRYFIIGI